MNLILQVKEGKRLMGLKVHQDGFKPPKSLEWLSAVCLHEIETNVDLMIQ
jgi:hypothetical protein